MNKTTKLESLKGNVALFDSSKILGGDIFPINSQVCPGRLCIQWTYYIIPDPTSDGIINK